MSMEKEFLMHHDGLNWILIKSHQRNISAKLESSYIEICPVVSDKKIFNVFYIALQGK